MTESTYKHYLHDLGMLIKEEALEAKQQRDIAVNDDGFARGELLTWYRVVSLMQQQAQAFGINLKDLRLDDIDPDKELT